MKVAPGGYRYGIALVLAGALGLLLHPAVGTPLVLLGVASVWFHRDPERSVPDSGVVAPADGTVSVLREEPDAESRTEDPGTAPEGPPRLLVGTFMNLHDVHVNRAPLPATVVDVEHEPGAHRPAFSKESDRNERVRIELDTDAGPVTVTLIAGAFARRIHPYVSPGDELDRGERVGHISFGSRVDVLLPAGIDSDDLAVERGEAVRAGETVLVPKDGLATPP